MSTPDSVPGNVLMGIASPEPAPVSPTSTTAAPMASVVPVTPESAPVTPIVVLPDLASVQAALEVFRQVEDYLLAQ